MKKLNLKKLREQTWHDDIGFWDEGEEVWEAMIEALGEAKKIISRGPQGKAINLNRCSEWLERFINED